MDRRAWLLAGTPLICGSCMGDIEPSWDEWRICDGWAEHDICHSDNPDNEALDHAITLVEDEYNAD